MGIVGPVCGYAVWKALRSMNVAAGISMFFTAFVADLLTYVTTAIELTLAFPGADAMATLATFLGVFAVTQIPLAIAEGLLSTVIYNYIENARPDLLVKFGVISENEVGAN